jgi:hypothetical protein
MKRRYEYRITFECGGLIHIVTVNAYSKAEAQALATNPMGSAWTRILNTVIVRVVL